MPISNSYPKGIPVEDQDLFVGTKAYSNRTVNYTAQGVADYLNINSKVSIGGQMSFQFTIVPNIPKTIAFDGGGGNNTSFSAITKLIVSAVDVSTANITIFLNYLNNSQVLLSQQNQPNFFGHYKITGYTQIGTSAFYELDLEFIGGNGTIIDKQYYDLISFVLASGGSATEWGNITGDIEDQTDLIDYISSQITTPTLQEVTDANNSIDNNVIDFYELGNPIGSIGGSYNFLTFNNQTLAGLKYNLDAFAGFISSSQDNTIYSTLDNGGLALYGVGKNAGFGINGLFKGDVVNLNNLSINFPNSIVGTDKIQTFQDASGTIALTSDITTPTLQEVLDNNHDLIDGNFYAGTTAGISNIGSNVNALGTLAAFANEGSNVNALGDNAANTNLADNVNALGIAAGSDNTFNNVNLFGYYAQADAENQNVFSKWISGTTKYLGRLSFNNITTDRKWELPDADGIIALTSDITDATLQNAYDNSTNGTIILDATRGNIKVKSIAGLTKFMSFFDNLDNELITFHSEGGANVKRISANNNGFFVDSGSNIQGNNLTITDIYSLGDIVLSNDKTLTSYLNPAVSHYFKGTSGVKWESNVKIEYAADYSALYTNRSLVDKEYVDSLIPGGGGGILHGTASGTDTYTVTIAGATAYADGDAYLIRFPNGNTTSATINISGLGAVVLYRNNDGPVIGGDIWNGAEMLCIYNSTTGGFQLIGTSPNAMYAYVTNDDTVTITKGQVVYAFGGQGDRMTVKLANNTGDATSAQTVGVVLSTSIGVNQKGVIITQGLLDGLSILPTATYNDGDPLYLGATNGSITNVKPYAPNHLVYLGNVTTASNGAAGRWYVRVQNGYELQELHNVQAQSPTLKDTLWYDDTVSPAQWKTASISTILGFTPEDVANKQTDLTASATKYPTVNAVNTGLALKQNILSYTPYRNVQTSQTVHTGTTSETLILTATIPAASFNSSDIIKILCGTNKTTALAAYTIRLRINTTNTIVGAPTIAIYNATATAQMNIMTRTFNLNGGNLYGLSGSSSSLTDILASGTGLASTTLNPANQFFIFATIQLTNASDTAIVNMLSISN